MVLDRDAILGADDLHTETVEVPEWDGEVLVRSVSGRERAEFEVWVEKADDIEDLADIRERIVALTVVDEDGDRLFTEEDVEALTAKSVSAIDRIVDVAQRINGLGGEGDEDGSPVEDMAGN